MEALFSQLEQKIQQLIAALAAARQENENLKKEFTHNTNTHIQTNQQIKDLQTQLLQEQERSRLEKSLLQQQNEQQIHHLNQLLSVQIAQAKEQAQKDNVQLQEYIKTLKEQNNQYYQIIIKSREAVVQLNTVLAEQDNNQIDDL